MKKLLGAAVGLTLVVAAAVPALAADRNAAPVRTISGPSSQIQHVSDIALRSDGTVFGASPYWDAVFAYAPNAGAGASPLREIKGSKTLINTPAVVAVAPRTNRVWTVLSAQAPYSIGAFPLGYYNNASPLKTIGGSNTGLSDVRGLAVSSGGDVYAVEASTSSIRVFYDGAGGNVEPTRVIAGANTQIVDPTDVAVDSADNVYVSLAGSAKILQFRAGTAGNVAPARIIDGPATGLVAPTRLAVDSGRRLYVTDVANDSVSVFAPLSNGNVAPVSRLIGASTGLVNPSAIAVAADRKVFVLDGGGPAIRVFDPLAPLVRAGAVRGLKVGGSKGASKRRVSWKPPTTTLDTAEIYAYRVVVKKGSKVLVATNVPFGINGLTLKRSKLRAGSLKVTVKALNSKGYGPTKTKKFTVVK
ncbi:hypothetical protein ABIE44_000813 [Marmoricola sp. OAE513]|uniref:hypothetical protein n=1 Tax=Marmoricola sp. OAE513 TaxID=2817894 RepID=UPI001AEAA683